MRFQSDDNGARGQRTVVNTSGSFRVAHGYGIPEAAAILARIDDYYADQHGAGRGVAAQLVRQLADLRPKDVSVTRELDAYRNLAVRWTD